MGTVALALVAAGPASAGDPTQANPSLDLQYLQLQEEMQHEARAATQISNILKTKHDTAKNSLNNIR
jgi:hypothetical protein